MRRAWVGVFLGAIAAFASASPARAGIDLGLSMSQEADIGNAVSYGMPVAALAVAAWHDDWQGAAQLTLLTAASVGTTFAIRSFVKERAPDGSTDRRFPSIQAAFSGSAEHYLWERYGWEYGVPAFFLHHGANYLLDRAHKHKFMDGLAVTAITFGFSHLIVSPYHRPVQFGVAAADDGTPMVAMQMNF